MVFAEPIGNAKTKSDAAMILMLGDDPEDHMARSGVRWLHELGINVMSMSPGLAYL